MSNLTLSQKNAKANFQKSLKKMSDEIALALPNEMDIGRFSRIVTTSLTRTPKLLECTQTSLFGSILLAAQLGLEPNGPDQKCFLIPYGNDCQFQLGYRGLLELARRSGELVSIHAEVIYEHDEFEIILGVDPTIMHKPKIIGERGKAILAYSVAKLKDGSVDFVWMSHEDIEKARKSNKGKSPAWDQWWSEMAKKVVMKRHLKTLPLNAESQRAVNSDESVKKTFVKDMTEEQEHEIEEEMNASTKDKSDFYNWLGDNHLSEYVSLEEKIQINGTCTKEFLKSLRGKAEKRAEADEKEVDVDEVKEEEAKPKSEKAQKAQSNKDLDSVEY